MALITQGRGSPIATEFCNYDEVREQYLTITLTFAFLLQGPSAEIQRELTFWDVHLALDELIQLTTALDNHLWDKRPATSQPSCTFSTSSKSTSKSPSVKAISELIQLGSSWLSSAQLQQIRETEACMYFGQIGNWRAECPICQTSVSNNRVNNFSFKN